MLVWLYVSESTTIISNNIGMYCYEILYYFSSRSFILCNDDEDSSGSILYLDLERLSCFISSLYHNLVHLVDDSYWVTVVLVLILHFFYLFGADPSTSFFFAESNSGSVDLQKIGWALGVLSYLFLSILVQSFVFKMNVLTILELWVVFPIINPRCSCSDITKFWDWYLYFYCLFLIEHCWL